MLLSNTIVILFFQVWQVLALGDTLYFANRNKYEFICNNTVHDGWSHIIQPSIFNNFPPFIKFSIATDAKTVLPPSIQKSLIWCRTVPLVSDVVRNTGLRLVNNRGCEDWIGFFNGKIVKRRQPKTVIKQPYQRYNQFPASQELCSKDRFWLNAQKKVAKFGFQDFDFLFESYAYPAEIFQFYQRNLYNATKDDKTWIFKPSKSTNSRGITVFNGFSEFPWRSTAKSAVIQKYLTNPHKIDGKHRLRYRTYIVVTSFHPLRIYLYENGDTNFELGTCDAKALFASNKNIFKYWASQLHDVKKIQLKIEDAIIKTMMIGEKKITEACYKDLGNKYNAYQFWTADFTFDKFLQPLLMEVNRYGTLEYVHKESALAVIPMLTETLNLAGYHFPPTLSKEGRRLLKEQLMQLNPKHEGGVVFNPKIYSFAQSKSKRKLHFNSIGFGNRSSYVNQILKGLEEIDIHELMIAEDELSRILNYHRIFPTSDTFRYLKYIDSEPYPYMVQDAWEHKYGNNRSARIESLKEHWRKNIYLSS